MHSMFKVNKYVFSTHSHRGILSVREIISYLICVSLIPCNLTGSCICWKFNSVSVFLKGWHCSWVVLWFSFIASRIRGRVARTTFDEFHRYSTRIVKEAVFGIDENDAVRASLKFSENNMVFYILWLNTRIIFL